MSVYVDDPVTLWRGQRWAHLMADTLEELHAMAARLGMPRRAFQDKRSGRDRGTGGDLVRHGTQQDQADGQGQGAAAQG